MAHDAPFPPNPFRPIAQDRELVINLVTATLASTAVQSENASREKNWRSFAEAVVDSPSLLVLSNNWLEDFEIRSIMASVRSPKIEVASWSGEGNPTKLAEENRALKAQIDHLAQWLRDNETPIELDPDATPVSNAITLIQELVEGIEAHHETIESLRRNDAEPCPAAIELKRLHDIFEGVRTSAEYAYSAEISGVKISAVDEKGRTENDRLLEALTADRDHLAKWLKKEMSAIIDDNATPGSNAIGVIRELQEGLAAHQETIRMLEARRDIGELNERAACERLDRLQRWLMLEFGDVLGVDEGPVDNAIYIIGELREKYRYADEAKTEISVQRNRLREQLEELELHEQARQYAAETKIPPQSIEDAKREAVRKLAEGLPVEEIHAGPRWRTIAAGKTPLGRNNRFKGVRSVSTLLNELAGAASMCWENVTAAGEFDSTKAKQAVEEALDQLDNIARHAVKSGDDDALAKAIWSDPVLNWMPPESADAKAFIDSQSRLHMVHEPDHGAVTNDLLKMVVERIDTITETVRQIVGGGTVKVRAEDTTFDNGPKSSND